MANDPNYVVVVTLEIHREVHSGTLATETKSLGARVSRETDPGVIHQMMKDLGGAVADAAMTDLRSVDANLVSGTPYAEITHA